MRLSNLTLAVAVGGLMLGVGFAKADPITYEFQAAPNFTSDFNGSTVTIDNNTITSWSLLDSGHSIDLTSANSTVNGALTGILGSDGSGFTGIFTVNSDATVQFLNATLPAITFSGGDSFLGGYLSDIVLPQNQVDPPGQWIAQGSAGNSVPDGANTLALLGVALAGLGACNYWLKRNRSALAVVRS